MVKCSGFNQKIQIRPIKMYVISGISYSNWNLILYQEPIIPGVFAIRMKSVVQFGQHRPTYIFETRISLRHHLRDRL